MRCALLVVLVCSLFMGCNQEGPGAGQELKTCITTPGVSYEPQTEKCCNGLTSITGSRLEDGSCSCTDGNCVPVCAPCGNGECEPGYGEDSCNCMDCAASYVEIGGKRIFVEFARTSEERNKGLMFREELCKECGMLFVFDHEDDYGFWMKNTLIPLDMVFIDSEFTVVDILRAEPCSEDPCPGYKPMGKALYVLEANKGTFDDGIVGERAAISIN